jgi:hypothetical protein
VTLERLLPADVLRPRWSSGNALVYIGGFVVFLAAVALLSILGTQHGTAALAGFSLLATAVAVAFALALHESERPVAAGVVATVAVVFLAAFLGALAMWIGILDEGAGGADYEPALLPVELLAAAAALAGLRYFRAPLLVLPIAIAFWAAVAELGSLFSWGGASELLSLAAGAVLVAAGCAVDSAGRRPCGFWLHLVGGVAFGGAVLGLAGGDGSWIVVGLVSLGYVAFAYVVDRSAYAVLGAIGALGTTTYFVQDGLGFVTFVLPIPFDPEGGIDPWQIAFYYVLAGLLILGLGLLGERFARRRDDTAA